MKTVTTSDSGSEILSSLIDLINTKLAPEKAALVIEFAKQFYGTVATEDLQTYSNMDLYGLILSLWHFVYERQTKEIKVRLYNPHPEQQGWQSTHTIVEIVCLDMPFIVDSVMMEIARCGYHAHFIMHLGGILCKRNKKNQIAEVLSPSDRNDKSHFEAVIHVEIDRQTDPQQLQDLQENLTRILNDVDSAVSDWHEMKLRMRECLTELESINLPLDREDINEAKDFLRWMSMDHFTFLGCRDYHLTGEGKERALEIVPDTGLGVLRDSTYSKAIRNIAEMPREARKQILSQQILLIAKTNTVSTVHRRVYTDYVGVKRFDKSGQFIGERRFIGLYTSAAYNTSPKYIPFLRRKVTKVMLMSGLLPTGHAAKALLNILETLPRDDLFQASVNELYELGMGIYHIQERRRIRLFVRKDIYDRFFSCLVYVPRDHFNTDLSEAMKKILLKAFNGIEATFSTKFSDSMLARIHFVVRVEREQQYHYDLKAIERELVEVARTWKDDLHSSLVERYGEERGNALNYLYSHAFPASYRENFVARNAVYDIEHIESINSAKNLSMSFYRLPYQEQRILHFKLFQRDENFTLSDALPMFENMGLTVLGEQPYEINVRDNHVVWINDFSVIHNSSLELDVDAVKDKFQAAFAAVWHGDAENDGFNRLVLSAQLDWREISVLRAYTKYLRQVGFTFSQAYIEQALAENANITKQLIELFHLHFAEKLNPARENRIKRLQEEINKALDEVINLDEDRIIRRLLDVIKATLRTNYFQTTEDGHNKDYISFKIEPSKIPEVPLPLPQYEIFVYSPRFEGVHLRMAKVARGGIRWSDRREDFRTEILGLMKAQQVKNAVIVPQGAKGGFVPKLLPIEGSREELMEEVINCYQNFIRGLLDVTDNLHEGELIKPKDIVCYDDDDPYLVVAADKGTATFSDIANQIAKEYGFWLGDAFASGGCTGYDHKKMGITARGAWESVKRNFRGLGINTDENPFTVIGIGDMSGDVFGNGMLLSKHIKLIGAFNHMHIFIDPHPDEAISFNERQRLFNLPRSTWEDYDANLISTGGGVFKRSAKYIKVTNEMREIFAIKSDFVTPNELIRQMLIAQVDLLWNGGIGTYVKASHESNDAAGDRANDAIRVDGCELNARVVAEGGNLGLTQAGRIEYSLNNGICFTDFIDNSAGVDCSDHEVNIKILLNGIVNNGDMTEKQRNQLLAEMSDEVAQLVLKDNYNQTLAITRAAEQAYENLSLYADFINELENLGQLDRHLECLPDAKGFAERKAQAKSFTRPEISVLLAYSKNVVKQALLATDIPEDPNLYNMLAQGFPVKLREKYQEQLLQHSLRREIIATQLSNTMLNEMGLTFVNRVRDESGATLEAVVKAYIIARRIFNLRHLNQTIIELDNKIDAKAQAQMFLTINRLIRRVTRWLLRNRRNRLDIADIVDYFTDGLTELKHCLPEVMRGVVKTVFEQAQCYYVEELKVDKNIAYDIACSKILFSAMDIIEGAKTRGFSVKDFAGAYYQAGEFLQLDWLREQIANLQVSNRWEALARSDYRDDIDSLQRTLTTGILYHADTKRSLEKRLEDWYQAYQVMVDRWLKIIANMGSGTIDYTMLYIVIRTLFDMALASVENLDDKPSLERTAH